MNTFFNPNHPNLTATLIVAVTMWTQKKLVLHLCFTFEGGEEVANKVLVVVGLVWVGVPLNILLEGIDLQLLGVIIHGYTRSN